MFGVAELKALDFDSSSLIMFSISSLNISIFPSAKPSVKKSST
jgi:hypothetical protein